MKPTLLQKMACNAISKSEIKKVNGGYGSSSPSTSWWNGGWWNGGCTSPDSPPVPPVLPVR